MGFKKKKDDLDTRVVGYARPLLRTRIRGFCEMSGLNESTFVCLASELYLLKYEPEVIHNFLQHQKQMKELESLKDEIKKPGEPGQTTI